MSLALVAKIEELTERVESLERLVADLLADPVESLSIHLEPLKMPEILAAKRGPGRPPKAS
jgi:hypothetical protein